MPTRATAPFDSLSWRLAALSAIGSSFTMERGAQHANLQDTKPHSTDTSYSVTVLARCRSTAVTCTTWGHQCRRQIADQHGVRAGTLTRCLIC